MVSESFHDISWETGQRTQDKDGIIDAMVDMRSDFFNTKICIDDNDRKEWDKYERGSDERKKYYNNINNSPLLQKIQKLREGKIFSKL